MLSIKKLFAVPNLINSDITENREDAIDMELINTESRDWMVRTPASY